MALHARPLRLGVPMTLTIRTKLSGTARLCLIPPSRGRIGGDVRGRGERLSHDMRNHVDTWVCLYCREARVSQLAATGRRGKFLQCTRRIGLWMRSSAFYAEGDRQLGCRRLARESPSAARIAVNGPRGGLTASIRQFSHSKSTPDESGARSDRTAKRSLRASLRVDKPRF